MPRVKWGSNFGPGAFKAQFVVRRGEVLARFSQATVIRCKSSRNWREIIQTDDRSLTT
jgi:hypothetical protein